MSINLTAKTKDGFIDLRQTSTDETWEFLYKNGREMSNSACKSSGGRRKWQETRDLYIAWLKPKESEYRKRYGKDWKFHFQEAEEQIQDHVNLLLSQTWIEFGFI